METSTDPEHQVDELPLLEIIRDPTTATTVLRPPRPDILAAPTSSLRCVSPTQPAA